MMVVKWRRVKRYNKKSVKGERSEVHNTLALFYYINYNGLYKAKGSFVLLFIKKFLKRLFKCEIICYTKVVIK